MKVPELDLKRAEELLKSIGIPVQPKVLMEIYQEIKKGENVDFRKISQLSAKDVGISARIMKVANSPFFGSGRINSLDMALNILGLNNFYNIVVASCLREALSTSGKANAKLFDEFWHHSMIVARITALVARKAKNISIEDAYMAGLFHDCAIPVLLKKFPGYSETFESAMGNDAAVIDMENEKFTTDHCIASYIIARSWRLSDPVCNVIHYHHTQDLDIHEDGVTKRLAACLILAECSACAGTMNYCKSSTVMSQIGALAKQPQKEDTLTKGGKQLQKILFELDMDDEDFLDLTEDAKEILLQNITF